MGLNKLSLLFLLNYFNQLGDVKDHLLLALKEVLLAIQTTLKMVNQAANKTPLGYSREFIAPLLKQVEGVVAYSIERINPQNPSASVSSADQELSQESRQLKNNIVQSIIAAIDEEITQTPNTQTDQNKLKVEALNTVKQVLMNHQSTPAATETKTSSQVA